MFGPNEVIARRYPQCDLCQQPAAWSLESEHRFRNGTVFYACDRCRRRLTNMLRHRVTDGNNRLEIRAQSIFDF